MMSSRVVDFVGKEQSLALAVECDVVELAGSSLEDDRLDQLQNGSSAAERRGQRPEHAGCQAAEKR